MSNILLLFLFWRCGPARFDLPCNVFTPDYLPSNVFTPYYLPWNVFTPYYLPCNVFTQEYPPCNVFTPDNLPCNGFHTRLSTFVMFSHHRVITDDRDSGLRLMCYFCHTSDRLWTDVSWVQNSQSCRDYGGIRPIRNESPFMMIQPIRNESPFMMINQQFLLNHYGWG